MTNVMQKDEFEQLLLLHGVEPSEWPDQVQAAASVFAQTAEGKALLEGEALLMTILSDEQALCDPQAMHSSPNNFLKRLSDIPALYQQEIKKNRSIISMVQSFLRTFDIEFSPAALVSQAAVFVIVLGLGVAVGAGGQFDFQEGLADVRVTEVDISEDWFGTAMSFSEDTEVLAGGADEQ